MVSKSKAGFLAVAVATAIVIVGARSATANIIVNGDFEANASGYSTFPGYDANVQPTNPTNPTGWTIQSGNHGVNGVDTASNVFGPANQSAARDYMFLQNAAPYSYEGQSLTLLPYESYRLEFDAAGRNGEGASDFLGFVVNDGTGNIFDIRTSSGGLGDINVSTAAFVHYIYYFQASAGAGPGGSLIFTNEANNHGGGDHTVVISNVFLSTIPEPSSLMLLGLGGLLVWRRLRIGRFIR